MIINKRVLNLLLGINVAKNLASKSTLSNRGGQARWDTYLEFIEDSDEAFLSRGIIYNTNTKNKVVFSHGLLALLEDDSTDDRIISSLIHNKEVYPYLGKDKPLSKPFSTPSDFWQNKASIVSATAEDVKIELSKSQLAADDYIFIDCHAYNLLREKYLALSPDKLNEEKAQEEFNQYIIKY